MARRAEEVPTSTCVAVACPTIHLVVPVADVRDPDSNSTGRHAAATALAFVPGIKLARKPNLIGALTRAANNWTVQAIRNVEIGPIEILKPSASLCCNITQTHDIDGSL
eukprot:scaffold3697_cov390-Prasinococcus_capsulatus_cf.AAC.5